MEEYQIRDGVLESYTGRGELAVVPEEIHTIGEGAFKACVSLKRVVLPKGLQNIMAGAFKGCRKLEEVEIPDGVSAIGDYAFHRCHSLKKIALPDSVKELGDCVFLYCDSLVEASLPGVRRFGRQVFVNDVQLKKLELSRELQEDCICDVFTGCEKLKEFCFPDGERCVVPNAVEVVAGGFPAPRLVWVIAVDVLRMMELDGRCLAKFLTNLKHVEIPEGIERLGKSSFFDKRGIMSVKFAKSLTYIDKHAFRNCINLESVSFEGEQTKIHEDAFKNCTSLKRVQMPDGTLYKLEGVSSLSGEEIPELVRAIHRQVLGNFRISGTILLKYLGTESRVAVPDGITAIAEEAFAGNEAIDRVILPESLREIGAGVFRDCLLLQTISFPERLERIGAGAFENCVKLIRVELPEKLGRLETGAFKRCRVLKEVSFPEGLREIGKQVFYGCSSLKEVLFPAGLKWIGEMAFYRCGALREVLLPSGVEHVGSLAFAQSGVRRVQIHGSGKGYGTGVFSGCAKLQKLVLGEEVKHIADKLAYGCGALKQIELSIPESNIESVGRNIWEGTPFLENWLLHAQEHGQDKEIFWDGRNMKGEIWLPENVRILAGGAFYGNTDITEVHLPANLSWIGAAAFKGCRALRRVYWPAKVRELEPEVFSGCNELEVIAGKPEVIESKPEVIAGGLEVKESELELIESGAEVIEDELEAIEGIGTNGTNIPEDEDKNGILLRWQRIGERAFYGCKKLWQICLEETIEIGKEAFSGCKSLERTAVSREAWIGERAFEGTAFVEDGTVLQVVGGIVVSADCCSGEICLPEGITGIAPFAFSGNTEITGVVLPESLVRIGEGAFWGCSALKSICFPKNPCQIAPRAFEKCTSLQEVELSATQLGVAAFAYCTSLSKAIISGISILGERLFEGCKSLKECICKDARAVKAFCFSACESLEQFDFQRIYVIKEHAFEGCDSLREAQFQEEACLAAHAFEDCGRLKEIILNGEGNIHIREYAFSGCTALQSVFYKGEKWEFQNYKDILSENIPEMVRLIFYSALSCFVVEKDEILCGYRGFGRMVRIPQGIRRIEAEVFRDAMAIAEITIPKSVEYIGARAFHGTAWIERQRQASPMVIVNQMLLDGSSCEGEVEIPREIHMICGWAFANGMKIEKIIFPPAEPGKEMLVEEYAFRNCIYLKEILLPDGTCVNIEGIADRKKVLPPLAQQIITEAFNCFKTDGEGKLIECTGNISKLQIAKGITAIGDGVFQDGNLLTEVIFSPDLKVIGNRAFAGCKWLSSIARAEGVEQIGDMAFFNCGMLERVEVSEHLRQIGVRAFEDCTSLKEIQIPEGIEEIPDKAFYRCHSLKRVRLPHTIKRIGKEAFAFCRELTELFLPENSLVEERAFVGCERMEIIRTP